jgi:hypothetical protein
MTTKKYLKIRNGNVELFNYINKIRTYYSRGDAVRVDWDDETLETVNILLKNGKVLTVTKNGNIS